MFCTSCGTRIERGQSHCTGCGAAVEGVAATAAKASDAARHTFEGWDVNFRKSIVFGLGSMLASLLSALLVGPAALLNIVMLPGAIAMGILALNAGRELANRTGYYLGMIGLVAGSVLLYSSVARLSSRSLLGFM